MLRGAYHFFHPESNNPAQQTNTFIQAVGADKGELPPVLDIEQVYVDGNPISLPTGDAMLALMKQWLDPVESAFGRKPMIYASAFFLNQQGINASWLNNYPLWVAQYPYAPGTNNEYTSAFRDAHADFGDASTTGRFSALDVLAIFLEGTIGWFPTVSTRGFQLLQWLFQ